MVPFAGYTLPVQFEGLGVLKGLYKRIIFAIFDISNHSFVEHLHTRAPQKASLFDVSHMGQIK